MKKNPGRRERRAMRKRSRTGRSAKLSAINERKLLRLSKRKRSLLPLLLCAQSAAARRLSWL